MSTNNENNKNGESLTINFQTAQLDPIDISRENAIVQLNAKQTL